MKKWIALGTALLLSTSFASKNILVHQANSVRQLPDNSILLSEINPAPRPSLFQKPSSTEHVKTIKTTEKKVNLASKVKMTLNPKMRLTHNKNQNRNNQSQHHVASNQHHQIHAQHHQTHTPHHLTYNKLHQQKIKHLAMADKHSRKITKPLTHHANQPSFAL